MCWYKVSRKWENKASSVSIRALKPIGSKSPLERQLLCLYGLGFTPNDSYDDGRKQ